MRIWDIHPGYLNRSSLLGEHRELHGIVSIVRNNKKGYAKHPETLRWVGHGWALSQRHKLLVAEMNLRGYVDKSPVRLRSNRGVWPDNEIDPPGRQINLLKEKYQSREPGRIPLPVNAQQYWAQHKYSVMSRDLGAYKGIGQRLASSSGEKELHELAAEILLLMKTPPNPRLLPNALSHMWGYVSRYAAISGKELDSWSLPRLLEKIQILTRENNVTYLAESTALSELAAWNL